MDDFFATHDANLGAIEQALTALTAMQGEFADRSPSARWFYGMTCQAVYDNYRLHCLISALNGAKSAWRSRVEGRALATASIEVIGGIGATLTRTLDKHLEALTDNPRILEPLAALGKQFAGFRRVNDKTIRVLSKELGIDQSAKPQERLAFDADLDAQVVITLAVETIVWLSAFGKAATLLISAIRGERPQAP